MTQSKRNRLVYVAHPLGQGADRETNRQNAMRWCARLAELFEDLVPVADWIILSGVWSEERRDDGLAIDFALIARCDAVWLCGGRVSAGMQLEREHAQRLGIPVLDLTDLGYAPPTFLPELPA